MMLVSAGYDKDHTQLGVLYDFTHKNAPVCFGILYI
jgi:hypothetical protein